MCTMKDTGTLLTELTYYVDFLPNKTIFSMTIPEVPWHALYLLASSLTLSISAINDTSLSMMLKKEKKENCNLIHSRSPPKSKAKERLSDISYGSFEISKILKKWKTTKQLGKLTLKLVTITVC